MTLAEWSAGKKQALFRQVATAGKQKSLKIDGVFRSRPTPTSSGFGELRLAVPGGVFNIVNRANFAIPVWFGGLKLI
jgi:hypothetical protein